MNLKSYITFLSRNKAYTAINIFGLSVSLMFVILIGLYYDFETGVDQRVHDGDRICLVHADKGGMHWAGTTREIMTLLGPKLPQIEQSCALYRVSGREVQYADDFVQKAEVLYADTCYFEFFGRTLVEGDARTALADVNSVVLSEEMAQRLFPGGGAVGKRIKLDDKYTLNVRGIYRTDEGTSLPQADLICLYELLRDYNEYMFRLDGNFGNTDVFLKLHEGTPFEPLIAETDTILRGYYASGNGWESMVDVHFTLTPFKETYFSDCGSSNCERGNPGLVLLISIMGLVVLVFAVMNYINLTVAQAGRRAREMATRRLLGSHKRDIVWRLIRESILMCALSVVVGLLLLLAAIPYANQVLETDISAMQLLHPRNIAVLVGGTLLLGTLTGIIPAGVMSAAKPIDVVRGTFRMKTKTTLSHLFMGVQHFITICLVAGAGILGQHTSEMIHAPLGYRTDSLLHISINGNPQKARLFKQRVKELPGIRNASICQASPLYRGYNNMGQTVDGKSLRFQRLYGDMDYMDVLGIPVVKEWQGVAGMHREGQSVTYVSADFYKMTGLPEGSTSFSYRPDDPYKQSIEGVTKEIILGNAASRENNSVTLIYLYKEEDMGDGIIGHMLIHVNGDMSKALADVQKIYREVYHREMSVENPWLSQVIAHQFRASRRTADILTAFASIALLISVLGLIAMSTYHIQQRRKEIALRKVFGSRVSQVRRRLIRQFLVHVLVAAIPAVPVIWFATVEMMKSVPYRIVWWHWIPAAILIVLLVSWLAVAVQSRIAAAESPVKNLKDNE